MTTLLILHIEYGLCIQWNLNQIKDSLICETAMATLLFMRPGCPCSLKHTHRRLSHHLGALEKDILRIVTTGFHLGAGS